jgi:hypothetical protein
MKKVIIFALMISCCSTTAFAQADLIIEGQVFDANGTPLENVRVGILDTGAPIPPPTTPAIGGIGSFTDSNGFFSIATTELYVDEIVQIYARCLLLPGRAAPPISYTTGSTRSLVVRDGVMIRNLFIQYSPKKKERLHCLTRLPIAP